jgi:hypothetical protein
MKNLQVSHFHLVSTYPFNDNFWPAASRKPMRNGKTSFSKSIDQTSPSFPEFPEGTKPVPIMK